MKALSRRRFYLQGLALLAMLILFQGTGAAQVLAAPLNFTAGTALINPVAILTLPQSAADRPSALASAPTAAAPTAVYFPDFGQFVADPLLRFWRMKGRYSGLGGPMSQAFTSSQGHSIQYFQKMALGYFPELANTIWAVRPYHIGRLFLESQADEVKSAFPYGRVPERANTQSSRYFPETGHTLSAGFLNLYYTTGELFMWGFPLSEEYSLIHSDGKTYNAQLFERGRMLWNSTTGAMIDPNFGTEMAALQQAPVGVQVNEAGPARTKAPNYSSWLWEHWVDVNLTGQYETFFEGDVPVRTSYVTTGKRGYETPTGTFYINRRVANERMRGGTIGAEDYYDLDNVLFTQYFTWEGHALHYAWWRSSFGYPGSHGCVNQDYSTSEFAWNWLTIGSRVKIHY